MSNPMPMIEQNQIIPNASPLFTSVALTTANSPSVIGSNTRRRGIIFGNPHASAIIYLAPAGAAIAAAQGIPLFPGATLTIMAQGNFQINCAWQAIASANCNLTILEFV
jgi:uncharacterized protein (DUF2345 family)